MEPQDALDYIEQVMDEYELRPGQKIDTLIQAIDAELEETEE
ncbi:unnamed protein product [marine sediment metagenome]|uniref:Uncharacterized protein n=1 Tax=marine sediment metagenome TaxID=412755 RepID=X1KNI6_9ZZZZ